MSSDGTDKSDKASKLAADLLKSNKLPQDSLQHIMSDPTAMASISEKLASAINFSLASKIPPKVLRKVNALKNLQKETTEIEAEFYKEVQALEAKYIKLYQPHYDKREAIVSGKYEPTDTECQWMDDEVEVDEDGDGDAAEAPIGIPEFWVTAFKNCDIFTDVIKECDDEVLSHLSDVKVVYADDKGMDFTIEYHFTENDWFTNQVLTMTYYVNCEVNEEDPWAFEGATIHSCQGCTIDWKKGKDLTVKTVKKKSKSKGKGQAKPVTKQVPNETFFNMFSFTKTGKADSDDAVLEALSDNYNRAEFIRDRLVPRAVLFFTGEAAEEDEDFDSEFEDEEEEGEGADDSYNPKQDLKDSKPPECKQQ